jgi:hypothetical protein
MILQWAIVALIGLVAVWSITKHFGFGKKKPGCPGCNACESKPRRGSGPLARL